MNKGCCRCGTLLDASAFGRDARSVDGLKSACRSCLRDVERERRSAAALAAPEAPSVPDGFKRCASCGELLSVEAFRRHEDRSDGRYSSCRECERNKRHGVRLGPLEPLAPASVPDGHKWCASCREILPVASFRRHTDRPDGLFSSCRTCEGADKRERRLREAHESLERGLKSCVRCEQDLPLASFPEVRRSPDGRGSTCSSCRQVQGPNLDDQALRVKIAKIGVEFDLLVEQKRQEFARRREVLRSKDPDD